MPKISKKAKTTKKTSAKKTPVTKAKKASKPVAKKSPEKKIVAKKTTQKKPLVKSVTKARKRKTEKKVVKAKKTTPIQNKKPVTPENPALETPSFPTVNVIETVSETVEETIPETKPQTTQVKVKNAQSTVWVTVIFVTTVIFGAWLYSLKFTVLKPIPETAASTAVTEVQLDEFVDNLKDGWSSLQENVSELEIEPDTLTKTEETKLNSTSRKLEPKSEPSTEELDSLFSDIN
ncbi:MAG: hypothetical protein Q8P90_04690 [bacterium]|nr:hypothetical protein [bacterium]